MIDKNIKRRNIKHVSIIIYNLFSKGINIMINCCTNQGIPIQKTVSYPSYIIFRNCNNIITDSSATEHQIKTSSPQHNMSREGVEQKQIIYQVSIEKKKN